MAISLRIIYWIPVVFLFIFNLTFKLIIFILQHIGNASVWCNRQFIKAGDYFTDLAKNDQGLDKFLEDLQKKNQQTKKLVDAKRGRK